MSIKKLLSGGRDVDALLEQQAAAIDRLKSPGKLKRFSAAKPGKKAFIRILFGDVHGEHMEPKAVSAFLGDVESVKPKEVVCMGDLLDCGGFLSQHKTNGIIGELESTYERDINAANMVLDGIHDAAPKASMSLIEGNHEARLSKWVCEAALGSPKNARFIQQIFGPANMLSLDKRGIRYVERHKFYDGLSISGTIKLEPHALAQHGEAFCGRYAAFRHLERLGRSVFTAHSHRLIATYAENVDGNLVSVQTGCLCYRRPVYMLTKTTDWQQGYVLQFVDPGKGFLALPVPIINGQSYLAPLLKLAGL